MTAFGARARLGAVIIGLSTVVGGLGAAELAAPADLPPARIAALQKLADCRKVADPTARLACYDEAAGAIDQAEAKGDIVVVDREQVRKVRRQAFGFTMPSLAFFDHGAKPEKIDEVSLKVESARQDGGGKWTIVLEGGQVWRQIDNGGSSRDVKPGATATIHSAMMGSYIMSVTGGPTGMRVHRED